MSNLLCTIEKEIVVTSATDLIHKFEGLKEKTIEEAMKKGYYPNIQDFNPTCSWEPIEENKIKLIFKLEITGE